MANAYPIFINHAFKLTVKSPILLKIKKKKKHPVTLTFLAELGFS